MSNSTHITPPAPPLTGISATPNRRSVGNLFQPEWAILPVLIVVIIVGAILNPSFLSFDNIYGVMQQASELGVLTMGLTLVLIAGKFDLSLESTFGLAPMLGVYCFLDVSGGSLGLTNSPTLALMAIDTIHHRELPGEGELDVPAFLREICAAGYRGVYGTEILSARHRNATQLSQRPEMTDIGAARLPQTALLDRAPGEPFSQEQVRRRAWHSRGDVAGAARECRLAAQLTNRSRRPTNNNPLHPQRVV